MISAIGVPANSNDFSAFLGVKFSILENSSPSYRKAAIPWDYYNQEAYKSGFHRRHVGAGIRLGYGKQTDRFAAQQPRQVFLLLPFVAKLEERHGGAGLHV
jgi:hypothetical protein